MKNVFPYLIAVATVVVTATPYVMGCAEGIPPAAVYIIFVIFYLILTILFIYVNRGRTWYIPLGIVWVLSPIFSVLVAKEQVIHGDWTRYFIFFPPLFAIITGGLIIASYTGLRESMIREVKAKVCRDESSGSYYHECLNCGEYSYGATPYTCPHCHEEIN